MKNKLFIVLLIIFVGSLSAYSQTGEEILKKSLKAMGSEKTANANSTYMETEISVMGQNIPMKIWKQEPKFRMESSQMGQNMIFVFNGTKGWMSMSGKVMEMPADKIEQMKAQSSNPTDEFSKLIDNDSVKIEKVGKSRVEGVIAYNLKITAPNNSVSNMYINSNTFLPVKITSTNPKAGGEVVVLFKNYKELDGVKMPSKMLIKAQGMEMTMKIVDYKLNPKIDDSRFNKPE